jgi:peptidoglycan L-alanyl-D-glutamate endopeptidase CwlK
MAEPSGYAVKFTGVHPKLVAKVRQLLTAMGVLGWTMIPTDGVRTAEQQAILYAQGRTAPGPVVTNADGVVKKSNHQPHLDGYGHAVDCCFLVNGKPSWADTLPWAAYGEAAKSLGLIWGGDWGSLHDRPHLELPDGIPDTGASGASGASGDSHA